jgi:hypothetical protein
LKKKESIEAKTAIAPSWEAKGIDVDRKENHLKEKEDERQLNKHNLPLL